MRKIEINEDDLKKVILTLKLSKKYVKIPSDNLALINLWRVSGKLGDKLMRKAGLVLTQNKGRFVLKPIEGGAPENETPKEETPQETTEVENVVKIHRCRKRKPKE